MSDTSLIEFSEIITNNLKSFSHNCRPVMQAAEQVNKGINKLLFYHIRPNLSDIRVKSSYMMGFGAYSTWVTAFIMTASGHFDSGISDMRRAIEFACYAAKVINNEKRAWAWIEQSSCVKSRQLFASSCSIPLSYVSEKYKFLWSLIAYYDHANYFGAHGNFETIIAKYKENDEAGLQFVFQSDPNPMIPGTILLLGFNLFKAFSEIFKNYIREEKDFLVLMDLLKNEIISARLEMAKIDYSNNIPEKVKENIMSDDQSAMEQKFFEYVERERQKRHTEK